MSLAKHGHVHGVFTGSDTTAERSGETGENRCVTETKQLCVHAPVNPSDLLACRVILSQDVRC